MSENKQLTAQQIADLTEGTIKGNSKRIITQVSSLAEATATSVSFIGNSRYLSQLETSKAGVILVKPDLEQEPNENQTFIVCDNIDVAFSKAIMAFAPPPIEYEHGIHPTAYVADSVTIGENVAIGPNATVEADAVIGNNSTICAGAYIGHQAKIGNDCLIYQNVTISFRCVLGNRVIIQPGVVLGGDGYGFAPTPTGIIKLPQVGIVEIQDDVEIGANTTIDRARFGKTLIQTGTKIDNQVMIAHNVDVGAHTLIVAQAGVAGSTKIGTGCIIAAKVGINGHITIGDGAQIAGMAGVKDSIPAGAIAVGAPAENQRNFIKRLSLPKKVDRISKKIKELEAEITRLKARS
ncbi:MAG: UDP-3-O-(3-hydroxymyristoyl)glucosamine N-acyltransferase [Victivallaceae bacterium]|nr:UDP-3-O-(3-hydroxymyristoyl)glucosamine N-acyltransferase [Victivallaceae bacterium]